MMPWRRLREVRIGAILSRSLIPAFGPSTTIFEIFCFSLTRPPLHFSLSLSLSLGAADFIRRSGEVRRASELLGCGQVRVRGQAQARSGHRSFSHTDIVFPTLAGIDRPDAMQQTFEIVATGILTFNTQKSVQIRESTEDGSFLLGTACSLRHERKIIGAVGR